MRIAYVTFLLAASAFAQMPAELAAVFSARANLNCEIVAQRHQFEPDPAGYIEHRTRAVDVNEHIHEHKHSVMWFREGRYRSVGTVAMFDAPLVALRAKNHRDLRTLGLSYNCLPSFDLTYEIESWSTGVEGNYVTVTGVRNAELKVVWVLDPGKAMNPVEVRLVKKDRVAFTAKTTYINHSGTWFPAVVDLHDSTGHTFIRWTVSKAEFNTQVSFVPEDVHVQIGTQLWVDGDLTKAWNGLGWIPFGEYTQGVNSGVYPDPETLQSNYPYPECTVEFRLPE